MIEFVQNNKEWIFSGIGVFILGLFIAVLSSIRRSRDKREERIRRFVDSFREIYTGGGRKLRLLIPAGINNFKNNREIEKGFQALVNVIPNHPLRNWNERIKRVGYKRFFGYVASFGRELNANNIEEFLGELED